MPIDANISFSGTLIAGLVLTILTVLTACERTPPDYRDPVTLPVYSEGDADNGAIIYEEACGQCHQLSPGSNKKGPQLMNIYGAPAAELEDYDYGAALTKSGWVWDAKTLDPYIADAQKAMPESKMLSDPMPDASERADIIAYLSTLRMAAPAIDSDGKPIDTEHTQMSDEPVEIEDGLENQPAASF
ncbi:c-type cytochrome [Psychrobacter sp. FBL11]|uniref:C-type cytochrome n=1 Tax=Psychrobacter saeujeotis TaxID=3143436 RepID=A0ABU9X8D0_9GAMM|nr:c-type cytochrome [uncultured Psychrobacter sp.]